MNSPSVALIWELWRKNRWGFALLLVLLAICAALSLYVRHLKERAVRLEASVPRVGDLSLMRREGMVASKEGILPPRFGPSSPRAPDILFTRPVQFKLGSAVVYEGMLSPGDHLAWSTLPGKPGWMRLSLGATNIFEGPAPPDPALSWTAADGTQGRAVVNFVPQYSEDVLLAYTTAQSWREAALAWSVVFMAFSVLVVFAIFGSAEADSRRGFTGIPPRKFTLPVQTGVLVARPITVGCCTAMLIYFAWSRLVFAPLLPDGVELPELYFAMLLPAGLVLFQALVWGLPSFPRTRVCLITLLICGLVPLASWPFEVQRWEGGVEGWSALQPKLFAALACAWAGGVAAAWFGVRAERRGGWSDWKGVVALARFFESLRPRPLEFRSALGAQFWIETRGNGRVPLFVWAVLMCVILVDSLLPHDARSNRGFADTTMGLAVVAGWAWLAITGLNLARDGASKKLALSSFIATRPVSTGSLLTAKLLAGAAAWTLAAMMLAVTVLVIAVTRGGLDQISDWPTIVVPLAISLHLFVGILPLLLSGRIAGFPWSLLPLLIVYGTAIHAFNWINRHDALFFGLVMLLALKLAAAYWGFRRALGFRLVARGFVGGYVALWCVGTGMLVLLAWVRAQKADWASEALVWIPGALLVLPLARIALSPLALAKNRHR